MQRECNCEAEWCVWGKAHQSFYYFYSTYCKNHRSRQDLSLLKAPSLKFFCPICLEYFGKKKTEEANTLKTPCCKNVFIHKSCIQVIYLFLLYRRQYIMRKNNMMCSN